MGNDPILSLSQSEVLNLYTMVTVIDWSVWQDLNLRFLTSKASRLDRTFSHTDKLWWRPGVSNPSRHSTCKAEPQPSAAPINTGTQCWLRSNYSRLIKTVPHHSVYWAFLILAREPGFEPGMTESKSVVFPTTLFPNNSHKRIWHKPGVPQDQSVPMLCEHTHAPLTSPKTFLSRATLQKLAIQALWAKNYLC